MVIAVRIHDLSFTEPNVYVAKSIDECHDEIDKDVFSLVLDHSDVITVGMVIGEPIYN